jgi:hypothetical protein
MGTAHLFSYNLSTNGIITGCTQYGNMAVSINTTDAPGFTVSNMGNPYHGPDEDLGYVIAYASLAGTRTHKRGSQLAPNAVGFVRSTAKTDASFVDLVNKNFNQSYSLDSSGASTAKSYLTTNGYWTSYNINIQGFSYSNFASTTGLVGVGTASVSSNIYFLTTAAAGQIGNVYRTTAIQYNRNFSTQWSTFIGGGSGADGYCIQWTPTNNTNGTSGGGVGYLSTAINAITFLTYTNNNYTWYKSNVSQGATSVSAGLWRQTLYFWGDYNHSAQTFALYWSTTNSKPGSANKTFTSFLFDTGSYYMGFGAATGGANDNHELLSWVLTFT